MKDMPQAAGNTFYEMQRKGKILTRKQAMLAKCADCMGHYVDGRVDCRVTTCPLFPFRPYKDAQNEKNTT